MGKEKPVIIFFHGGAWQTGKKENYRFVADAFNKLGYVVVIPDYIKYPQVKFPEWQKDGAKAVSWTYNNIKNYGGDNNHLFLVGHSAGAHIAALLAADKQYLEKENLAPSIIKSFSGIAGPYNFEPAEPDYIDMFGPPERYKLMHVSNYIDGRQPPMLLLQGGKDKEVAPKNLEILVDSIKGKGGRYKVITYPEADHIDVIATLSKASSVNLPVAADIDEYFKEISRQNLENDRHLNTIHLDK